MRACKSIFGGGHKHHDKDHRPHRKHHGHDDDCHRRLKRDCDDDRGRGRGGCR
ncbi:MAG TPA: hypothetical protein VGH99_10110 [Pseudonocardia sp.]|jgi:hypothetical protein